MFFGDIDDTYYFDPYCSGFYGYTDEKYKEITKGKLRPRFFTSEARVSQTIGGPVPEVYQNLMKECWAKDERRRPTFGQIVERLGKEEFFLGDAEKCKEMVTRARANPVEAILAMADSGQSIAEIGDSCKRYRWLADPFGRSVEAIRSAGASGLVEWAGVVERELPGLRSDEGRLLQLAAGDVGDADLQLVLRAEAGYVALNAGSGTRADAMSILAPGAKLGRLQGGLPHARRLLGYLVTLGEAGKAPEAFVKKAQATLAQLEEKAEQ